MTNKLTHLSNHTVTAVLATDTLDATELDATIDAVAGNRLERSR